MPMIIALRCSKEQHCAGLGDRMFSMGSAFWLVRSLGTHTRRGWIVAFTQLQSSTEDIESIIAVTGLDLISQQPGFGL